MHPSGQFVYSSNRGHDTVSVYQANPKTGKLKVIQVQPIRGAFPRNINLTPNADWLLAAGADSNTIAAHRIDQETGKLTYQTGFGHQCPLPHLHSVFGLNLKPAKVSEMFHRGRNIRPVFPN